MQIHINNTTTLTLRRSNELSIQVHKTLANQHASLHQLHHPHFLQWLNVFHMPTHVGLLAITLLLEWTWTNKLGVKESHHTLLLLLSLISGLLWLVYCDAYVMTTCSGEVYVCQSCLLRTVKAAYVHINCMPINIWHDKLNCKFLMNPL